MRRANSAHVHACPDLATAEAWKIERDRTRISPRVTRFQARHVVDFKALSETTSRRKRTRPISPPKAVLSQRQPAETLGNQLARELHDSVAQTLSTMLLDLENFRVEQYGRAGVLKQVDLLERSTRKALGDLRALLVGLRAQHAGEEDLVKLIRRGMLDRKVRSRPVEFGLQVAPDWPETVPAAAAMELYHIIAEAIDNAIRHSGAKKIDVELLFSGGGQLAIITITDDGAGIREPKDPGGRPGLGILGMRERAALLDGEVHLTGVHAGRGTIVHLSVPASAVCRPRPNV